jgi:hypothetical protein
MLVCIGLGSCATLAFHLLVKEEMRPQASPPEPIQVVPYSQCCGVETISSASGFSKSFVSGPDPAVYNNLIFEIKTVVNFFAEIT